MGRVITSSSIQLTLTRLCPSHAYSKVGDVVLAKIRGFPAWPGVVSSRARCADEPSSSS